MVSVIIPTYNYGHLISETIESIKAQTYSDWEIIVVDDGSSDNTESVVQSYIQKDNRIQYIRQQNAGPSAARNKAISLSKGDYIQFLDADDVIERDKFLVQVKLFEQDPGVGIVYGSVRYFRSKPFEPADRLFTYWGSDSEWMPKISGNGLAILPRAIQGNFAHISCFLFRRTVVEVAGKWDETKRASEDYLFVLECVFKNTFFLYHDTPDTYALVRWHENNASRNLKWIHDEERKMHIELIPRLAQLGNREAIINNHNAIKALKYMSGRSWKRIFLSGGPFDALKKALAFIGIARLAKKMFYGRNRIN